MGYKEDCKYVETRLVVSAIQHERSNTVIEINTFIVEEDSEFGFLFWVGVN